MEPALDAKPLALNPTVAQYEKAATDLFAASRSGDHDATQRLDEGVRTGRIATSNSHRVEYSLSDAQRTIAREHGFESWTAFSNHVRGLERGPIRQFESAVDAVVTGDVPALESLLHASPGLVRARSGRVHRATLLHYVSANGVENFRQQTPPNAVTIAKVLFDAGAEADALAHAYGGHCTTMGLLVSSVHPARAGVQVALVETLLDHGAAINGPEDDGSPLATSLAFHYPDAAAALAKRHARIDHVAVAAALGREDLVRRLITDGGHPKPLTSSAVAQWARPPKDQAAHRELALVWGAEYGRTEIVNLLLQNGVDVTAKDHRAFSALHSAAFYGHVETVEALLKWNAPLETKNSYGGTVLSSTIWASVHGTLAVDYVPVVERLIAAGALIDAVTVPTGDRSIDAVLARRRANWPVDRPRPDR
jgi:hypothetical protein